MMRLNPVVDPSTFGHPLSRAVRDGSAPDGLYATLNQTGVPDTKSDRASVVAVLSAENARLANPHGARACEALADPRCRVVITGQQPGLFGGPLFTFEKLAGAMALASRIESDGRGPCVAIYWNQSEDHDLVEINRMEIPKRDGVHRETAPLGLPGRCFDHIVVDDALALWADASLALHWPGTAFPDWLRPRIGEKLPDWTSRILLEAFADRPFLVAEPGWFRHLAAPLYAEAVRSVDQFHAAMRRSTDRVIAAGYEPQIAMDEPSGLFLVEEDGTRLRLHRADGWRDARGRAWTDAELLDLATMNPRRLSTSVQIRPLVQSWLLPVVAQVGGPAEVAYFAQFGDLYAAAGLRQPFIVQRPASVFLGAKEAAWAKAASLDVGRLLDDPARWPSPARPAVLPASVVAHLEAVKTELLALPLSEPLRRAVEGFTKSTDHALEKLEGTLRREAERAEGVDSDRRARLTDWLRPKGRPQDRMLTLPDVLARMTLADFRTWMASLDPLDPRTMVATVETAT